MDSSFKENMCVVCFHNISIYAVGDCDHYDRICYICSTRLRVLCNKYECPICRKDIPKVIFSKHKQPYGSLSKIQYPMDHKYKIAFVDDEVRGDYETLLEHPCHKCTDKRVFRSFGHLKDHTRKDHELFFCELCVDNLKLFTHERRCYTRKELGAHRRVGDEDDKSHRGHPRCQFCEERYLDEDELFRHLRKEHYYCHFCDENGLYQFYGDYKYLRDHFRDEHFLCEEGDCREEQFTCVFRSQIDLKAHKATQHCKNMNKQQVKQARTLELEFTIRPRIQPQNPESYDAGARRGRKGPAGSRPSREQSQQPPQQQARNNHKENDFEDDGMFSLFNNSEPAPDTQCQKQFPQLGDGQDHLDGKVNLNAAVTRPYGRNYNPQSEEDFPTLSGAPPTARINKNTSTARVIVSQPSMPTANSVLFKINNNNKDKVAGSGNISIQVSSQAKASVSKDDFPSLSTRVQNVNVSTRESEIKKQPVNMNKNKTDVNGWSSSNITKKSDFESAFPNLVGKAKEVQPIGRSTLTIPVGGSSWSKSNTIKGNPAEIKKPPETESTVKSKSKKSSKTCHVEVGPKTKENNNKKKDGNLKVGTNKNTEESVGSKNNSEPVSLPKKTKSSNNNDIGSVHPELVNSKAEKTLMPKICAEEFPPLMSGAKPPAPPGFSKPNPTSDKPPPGFQSSTPNSLNKTITALTLSSVAKQFLNPCPLPLVLDSIPNQVKAAYMEPNDFENRNHELIAKIRDLLDADVVAFSSFKQLSGQFRQNLVQAREYYDKCISIFGKEKFQTVLPELLVLLPDIAKEQELLTVFNQACKREGQSSGAVPKSSVTTHGQNSLQLLVCATCQQVLAVRDFQKHMLAHNEDTLFPPLAGNSETAVNHISWVKK